MKKKEMGTLVFETEGGRAHMAMLLRQLANTVETSGRLDLGQYSVRGKAKRLPDTGQVWKQQDMEDSLDVNIAFRLEGIDLQKARALDAKDKRAAKAVEALPEPPAENGRRLPSSVRGVRASVVQGSRIIAPRAKVRSVPSVARNRRKKVRDDANAI